MSYTFTIKLYIRMWLGDQMKEETLSCDCVCAMYMYMYMYM